MGCGTGNLSFCLSANEAIRAVYGIDVCPAYVEYATRHARDGRLTFQVADACALPFPDAAFDHAASLLVLQFVPRPERAVREMRRVTRRGGTVAAATWDTGGGLVAYRMVFDTAALLDADGAAARAKAYGRRLRRAGELSQAWRDAGLVDVIESALTIRMEFASTRASKNLNRAVPTDPARPTQHLSSVLASSVRTSQDRLCLDELPLWLW